MVYLLFKCGLYKSIIQHLKNPSLSQQVCVTQELYWDFQSIAFFFVQKKKKLSLPTKTKQINSDGSIQYRHKTERQDRKHTHTLWVYSVLPLYLIQLVAKHWLYLASVPGMFCLCDSLLSACFNIWLCPDMAPTSPSWPLFIKDRLWLWLAHSSIPTSFPLRPRH